MIENAWSNYRSSQTAPESGDPHNIDTKPDTASDSNEPIGSGIRRAYFIYRPAKFTTGSIRRENRSATIQFPHS
jgi:hypothetical protein